jgi:hypothetical protein
MHLPHFCASDRITQWLAHFGHSARAFFPAAVTQDDPKLDIISGTTLPYTPSQTNTPKSNLTVQLPHLQDVRKRKLNCCLPIMIKLYIETT